MLTLISATPSPYARKNRIAMHEKRIPFQLQSEIPWESATKTPLHNPVEKLPVLLFDDDSQAPIYESWLIQEYIVMKYADRGPRLMPGGVDEVLMARQVQVVADGGCDAMVSVLSTALIRCRGEMVSRSCCGIDAGRWH